MSGPKLKVCPSCGSVPWDFHNPGTDKKNQPAFCQDCGDKLVGRSELPRDIWKDPAVKDCLKEGRSAYDIQCLRCPGCDQLGYWNEGSTFTCRFCDEMYLVESPEEVDPDDQSSRLYRTVSCDEAVSLADTVTETTDGYHNETK